MRMLHCWISQNFTLYVSILEFEGEGGPISGQAPEVASPDLADTKPEISPPPLP